MQQLRVGLLVLFIYWCKNHGVKISGILTAITMKLHNGHFLGHPAKGIFKFNHACYVITGLLLRVLGFSLGHLVG